MIDNRHILRNLILDLYKEDAAVANDDKLLISRVWLKKGWSEGRTLYENMRLMPNPGTIIRTRAKLVEKGLIKSSESVQLKRNCYANQVARSI